MIVEYMMHRNEQRQLITPTFVDDGGYFENPADGTFIGWIGEPRAHYVPDTVVVLTEEALRGRLVAIHGTRPYRDRETGEPLDEAGVCDLATAWAAVRSGGSSSGWPE